MSMDFVFVTGGTGFLGQNLLQKLSKYRVKMRVLVRPKPDRCAALQTEKLAALGAEIIWGDILNQEVLDRALEGVTHVYHLAGQLFIPGVPPGAYERLHVEGTKNLLLACARAGGVERIIHCSSTGVLGPTGRQPKNEEALPQPSNPYEYSKAEGERIALAAAEQHGLHLVIARPALAYGPGDLHLLSWFRTIQRRQYRVVGTGDNLLHPIYVGDVIQGLLRCAQSPAAVGRVYHLVGQRPVPIREMAETIARVLSCRLSPVHLPTSIAYGVASLLEALPGIAPARLPLTRSRVRFMTESRVYSGDRAREELGFVPEVDLRTGLQRTVSWYRREGYL